MKAIVIEAFRVKDRGTVIVLDTIEKGSVKAGDWIRLEMKTGRRKRLQVEAVEFLLRPGGTSHVSLVIENIRPEHVALNVACAHWKENDLPKGWYDEKAFGIDRCKNFSKAFNKKVPHSDGADSAFIDAPAPKASFPLTADTHFEDLAEKMMKVFYRLRGECGWLGVEFAFSPLVFANVTEWDRTSAETAWGQYGPRDHFENMHFVAEDISYGMSIGVFGGNITFWGKPLLSMINSNRQLWPLFWKKSANKNW